MKSLTFQRKPFETTTDSTSNQGTPKPTSKPPNPNQPTKPATSKHLPSQIQRHFRPQQLHPFVFWGSSRRHEELRIASGQLQRRIGPAGSGEAALGGGKNGGMTGVM